MLICGFEFGNGRFQKDTADGEADLKYGGDNAEWVEDPLVPGQSTPPGQLSEHDGVKTDACEAEGSTQVVEELDVTRLHMRVRESKTFEIHTGHN